MPLAFGLKAYERACEEQLTNRAWDLYLIMLPNWDSKDRMDFKEFLAKARGKQKAIAGNSSTIDKRDLDRYADIANLKRSQ